MLTPSSLPAGERQLYSQLKQLLTHPGLLRGSLIESRRTCGKSTCRCRSDRRRRHRSVYMGVTTRGKTRMIYVPAEWEAQARAWLDRHQEVRKILERLCEACVTRLKRREL
ncbi:MAG: DUF6788 family protein [Gemmatimonadales bacterium]